MNYRLYLAALLLAGFTFTATPAAAQGYAGVLPAENVDSSDDGALPFTATQMGAPAGGSQANVTDGGGAAAGGGESGSEEQASAEGADVTEGEAPDPSDIFGLNGDTTLSTDEQNQPTGKTGFMAMIGGDEKSKDPKGIDTYVDETPTDLYRAMEGSGSAQSEGEKARLRLNRQLEAARIEHDKEIDAMNAARMRDNQIKAQEEMDRITAIQQEALTRVREANGTATDEDYEALNSAGTQESDTGTGEAVEGVAESAEGTEDLTSDDNGKAAE
ncbi:MAG: hypothetical protein ACAH80_04410 [Alphaproteobacteria bacterium]